LFPLVVGRPDAVLLLQLRALRLHFRQALFDVVELALEERAGLG
jgi:hypothetical protein